MATKLKGLHVKKVDFVDEGANPDADIKLFKSKNNKPESIWKRLADFFAREAETTEVVPDVTHVKKAGAMTFSEQMNERKTRKIADEIWDICFALENSLTSIMRDEELDATKAAAAMTESLEEFSTVITSAINQWSQGKTASISKIDKEVSLNDVEVLKSAKQRIESCIEKAEKNIQGKDDEKNDDESKKKGEKTKMNIDKSKLTESERLFLESIEKRYGIEESGGETTSQSTNPEGINKGFTGDSSEAVAKALMSLGLSNSTPVAETTPAQEDIYKGLHPKVKAELETLRKFAEESEERSLREVAKKYEIIGKKEDELFPVLKSLKAAGGTAYEDMIAVLDQTVNAIEKSGVFSEIGKVGHDGGTSSVAKSQSESKIDAIAKGYMEKDANLTYIDAIAKAWENNADLIAAYEEDAGF